MHGHANIIMSFKTVYTSVHKFLPFEVESSCATPAQYPMYLDLHIITINAECIPMYNCFTHPYSI